MKAIQTICAVFAAAAVGAAEIDVNGGFENVAPELGGKVAPAGWAMNTSLSKNAKWQLTKEPGTFHSGKFGMLLETQPGGRIFFQRISERTAFPIGGKLKFTVWAKGTGRIYFGCFCFGKPEEGEKKEVFLRTLMVDAPALKDVADWTEYTVTMPIARQKVGNVWYSDLIGRIMFMVNSDAELYIDDLKVELIEPEKK